MGEVYQNLAGTGRILYFPLKSIWVQVYTQSSALESVAFPEHAQSAFPSPLGNSEDLQSETEGLLRVIGTPPLPTSCPVKIC